MNCLIILATIIGVLYAEQEEVSSQTFKIEGKVSVVGDKHKSAGNI